MPVLWGRQLLTSQHVARQLMPPSLRETMPHLVNVGLWYCVGLGMVGRQTLDVTSSQPPSQPCVIDFHRALCWLRANPPRRLHGALVTQSVPPARGVHKKRGKVGVCSLPASECETPHWLSLAGQPVAHSRSSSVASYRPPGSGVVRGRRSGAQGSVWGQITCACLACWPVLAAYAVAPEQRRPKGQILHP